METYKAAIAATKSKDTVKVANEVGEVDSPQIGNLFTISKHPRPLTPDLSKNSTKNISNQKLKSLTIANCLNFLIGVNQ